MLNQLKRDHNGLPSMHRIAVIGTSCSGKTTFACRLADRLGSSHIELDAIHWGPRWTENPRDHVRARVDELTRKSGWVADGNYAFLRDLIWRRADTIVWLNYSFPVVAGRAFRRTIGRSFRRKELWSGNRESFRRSFFSRESILLWVLQSYEPVRREYQQVLEQPEYAHLRKIEFRRPAEADRFLEEGTKFARSPMA